VLIKLKLRHIYCLITNALKDLHLSEIWAENLSHQIGMLCVSKCVISFIIRLAARLVEQIAHEKIFCQKFRWKCSNIAKNGLLISRYIWRRFYNQFHSMVYWNPISFTCASRVISEEDKSQYPWTRVCIYEASLCPIFYSILFHLSLTEDVGKNVPKIWSFDFRQKISITKSWLTQKLRPISEQISDFLQ